MGNRDKVEAMVINPFTHNVVMPKEILEIAEKRRNAVQQTKTVKMTEKQFQELVHNRVAMYLLPKYLFAQKDLFPRLRRNLQPVHQNRRSLQAVRKPLLRTIMCLPVSFSYYFPLFHECLLCAATFLVTMSVTVSASFSVTFPLYGLSI